MHRISTTLYGIGQGFKNIRRNRMFSLASIGTMTACLFLFGIFYFILANFQHLVKSAEQNVGVTVFFDFGISDEKIEEIGQQIRKRAEVGGIEFTSAEEAWEKYKEEKLDDKLIQTFGDDNPLEDSASYTVYINDVDMQRSLVKYIEGLEGVRQVNNNDAVADAMSGFNMVITYVSGGIIVVLLGVAAFLISTTVTTGISVRKQELSIMKLIGATDSFIGTPYIVEGILIGIVGAVIPLVILRFLYGTIIQFISERFNSVLGSSRFMEAGDVFAVLIPISLAIGIGIGFLGSLVTVRRKIRNL